MCTRFFGVLFQWCTFFQINWLHRQSTWCIYSCALCLCCARTSAVDVSPTAWPLSNYFVLFYCSLSLTRFARVLFTLIEFHYKWNTKFNHCNNMRANLFSRSHSIPCSYCHFVLALCCSSFLLFQFILVLLLPTQWIVQFNLKSKNSIENSMTYYIKEPIPNY